MVRSEVDVKTSPREWLYGVSSAVLIRYGMFSPIPKLVWLYVAGCLGLVSLIAMFVGCSWRAGARYRQAKGYIATDPAAAAMDRIEDAMTPWLIRIGKLCLAAGIVVLILGAFGFLGHRHFCHGEKYFIPRCV